MEAVNVENDSEGVDEVMRLEELCLELMKRIDGEDLRYKVSQLSKRWWELVDKFMTSLVIQSSTTRCDAELVEENCFITVRNKMRSETGGSWVRSWLDECSITTTGRNSSLKNEIRNEEIMLPPCTNECMLHGLRIWCMIAIGFDDDAKVYKVAHVFMGSSCAIFCEVIEVDGGPTMTWKAVAVPESVANRPLDSFQSLTQRSVMYWLDCERNQMITFDIRSEVFETRGLPEELADQKCLILFDKRGSLRFLRVNQDENDGEFKGRMYMFDDGEWEGESMVVPKVWFKENSFAEDVKATFPLAKIINGGFILYKMDGFSKALMIFDLERKMTMKMEGLEEEELEVELEDDSFVAHECTPSERVI